MVACQGCYTILILAEIVLRLGDARGTACQTIMPEVAVNPDIDTRRIAAAHKVHHDAFVLPAVDFVIAEHPVRRAHRLDDVRVQAGAAIIVMVEFLVFACTFH